MQRPYRSSHMNNGLRYENCQKLYKTALSEEYKRFLKFHASKEKQTDFIFSGGLKSAHDIQERVIFHDS